MNKIKFLLLFVVVMFVSLGLIAQTKLIEKVTKKGDELVIPYEKYVLPNGLTLVVHEDHSDPVVHVDVTYHVGSDREEIGKSGFAHFFEHMMFQGSDHVGDEQHFKIVTEVGGTLNGSTNSDRTNYFETVPSNQLETALWLESDRMGFLLDAVTPQKFEVQRSTVKNERGQNVDNQPYGPADEKLAEALYPYGHPYSWPVIGYLTDLDRADLADLKKFFLRWYGPNNATLTIGGDVNPKEVVKLVEKYFGTLPKGPDVQPIKVARFTLDKDRYVSYVDHNIRFPALMISFPGVPDGDADEAPLDLLANILGGGKNSIFYQKFVKTQKAVSARVSNSTSELAGSFDITVMAMPKPGLSLAELEKEIREAVTEFEKRGVTDEDILRYRNQYESRLMNRLTSVSGKVSTLAAFQTFRGNPNQLQKDLARYSSITKDDVLRVYNKYVKNQHAVILSVLTPNMEGQPAQPDNFTVDKSNYKPVVDPVMATLTYKKPTNESLDRNKQPAGGQTPLVQVPTYWTDNFANGIKVIGTKYDEVPLVTLSFTINGGHKLDAYDLSKAGLSSLTASLMNESTENYTAEQLSVELEKLGSSISVFGGEKSWNVRVSSLLKNLDPTLKLLEEKMFKPKFAEDEFKRVKQQQIEGIKASERQAASIANNVYRRLLFGEGNIYAIPTSGYQETVSNIQLDDVKNFYSKYFAPNLTELVVVGDINKADILKKLSFLNSWKKKDVVMPTIGKPSPSEKTKIYLVDKPKAPQSEIRIGYLTGQKFDATGEFYETGLMNYILGGAFNSHINLNLREDKGWTYGARSSFIADDDPGYFTAQAGIRADATDSSVVEFMKEITNYAKTGITKDEISFMKNSIGQSDARRYETPFQKAAFISQILHYNLPGDFVTKQNKILNSITESRIDELAKKLLPYDSMRILVVGDKALVKPGLEKLGYQIVEVDERGKIIDYKVEADKTK